MTIPLMGVAAVPAILVGLVGGMLVGTTSVGAGSVIAALLLVVYPRVEPVVIVGSATTQAVIMKLVGVWIRRPMRLGGDGIGVAMAAGAIPLAVLGAWTSSRINASMLQPIIAVVLAAVGGLLMIQGLRREVRAHAVAGLVAGGGAGVEGAVVVEAAADAKDPPSGPVAGIGALVGYVAGLTSIGTGTLFVSALVGPLSVEAHRAVAAALLAGLLTLVVSAGTHITLGHVDSSMVLLTACGSVPGVVIGTMIGRRLKAYELRAFIGLGILIAAAITLARLT